MSKDCYTNFDQLSRHAVEGRDYRITVIARGAALTVAAIHGGGIEPGTSELALAIAGQEFNCYLFEGLRPGSNEDLHISSIYFDEPRLLELLQSSQAVLTVHGCTGSAAVTYIGGRDEAIKKALIGRFRQAGWAAHNGRGALSGSYAANPCNRGQSGQGVQLEFSRGLRSGMFQDVSTRQGRQRRTALFQQAAALVRAELLIRMDISQS